MCNYGNGWRCNNGECIDAEWVCDGEYQCEYDNFNDPDDSDEIEGCQLYPGKEFFRQKLFLYSLRSLFTTKLRQ